ncbi:MAG: DNA adenine methylase [Desulfomonile tiedjei]|nr:DNA adenine methylase [Desulfomonile tiedjei]
MPDFVSIPGAKELAIPFLWLFIPLGITQLVTPFLGAAKFERFCCSQGIEVFGSDIDPDIYNFWYWMLNAPLLMAELVTLLEPLMDSDRFYRRRDEIDSLDLSPLRAVEWWLLNRCSFNSGGLIAGYSQSRRAKLSNARCLRDMALFYCPNLHVEHLDYRAALLKYPDMFAYLDPPYILRSRLYPYSEIDHRELCSILSKRDRWILSYGNHPTIRSMYSDHTIIDLSGLWHKGMGRSNYSNEILIVSDDIVVPTGFKRCA